MGVSENKGGPPKSSILTRFSIINHPFWGFSPYFWKHPYSQMNIWKFGHHEFGCSPRRSGRSGTPSRPSNSACKRDLFGMVSGNVTRNQRLERWPTQRLGIKRSRRLNHLEHRDLFHQQFQHRRCFNSRLDLKGLALWLELCPFQPHLCNIQKEWFFMANVSNHRPWFTRWADLYTVYSQP